MDRTLFFAIYGDGHGIFAWTMIALSFVGSGWSTFALLPLVASRRTRSPAALLMLALGVNALVVYLMKLAIHRVRPCSGLPGVHAVFFNAPTDASFPSGHAAGSFCVAAYCIVLLWGSDWPTQKRVIAGAMLLLTATGIAVSRVYLGVHYPLDVAGGAVLGTFIGSAFALRARGRSIQTAAAE